MVGGSRPFDLFRFVCGFCFYQKKQIDCQQMVREMSDCQIDLFLKLIIIKKILNKQPLMQISSRIQQKIGIQEGNEVIAYYEYLRSITQITQLSYWIGNPSVEIISGKILLQSFLPLKTNKEPESYQLYLQEILKANKYRQNGDEQEEMRQFCMRQKDSESSSLQDESLVCDQTSSPSQSPLKPLPSSSKPITSRCLVLCGIPNSKPPVQVMQTCSISSLSHLIKQIRVIKTVHIKYYGMLLLMKDEQCAAQFFNELFGSEYNDLEMERIIIREVKNISLTFSQLTMEQGGSNEMKLLRAINEESEYIAPENIFMTFHYEKLKEKHQQSGKMQQPTFNELVCAICFEQCNKQAISILCGHYFDLECLQKWSEQTCPLCRYHQQPPIIKFCEKCNQCEGLWVCLICGSRLCCGVNNDILGEGSHIYDHFKQTSHSLSMELQTKFLFDAKIPAFLHQKFYRDLIRNQNEEDQLMQEKNIQENTKKDKITQQIQQYELQVSEQMKRQRLYFEEQINQSLKQHRNLLSKKRQTTEHLSSQIESMDSQQKQALLQISQLQASTQKKTKQLQIIKNLIKLKAQKVQEKRLKITQNKKLKQMRLKELQLQIRQKKQEILNYRKNLQIRERFSEKLKGEEVEGEFVIGGGDVENKVGKNINVGSKKKVNKGNHASK